MAAAPRPSSVLQKNVKQRLLLASVLTALGMVMAAAQWRDYRDVGRAEREQLRTQTQVADKLITTQIQSADAALRTMIASMERWRGPDGYLPFAQDHLKRVADMMPGARTFAVLSPTGICQLSSRTELLGVDLSKRQHFLQASADKAGRFLHISAPYQTVLGIWTVTVSRTIIRPNGEYGGVVTATLSPGYFENAMKDLRYATDMRVTLIHDQGQIYVTSPPNVPLQNQQSLSKLSFFQDHIEAGLPESAHQGLGLDGRNRLAVSHTIALEDLRTTHRFVAVASREVSAVYAAWRALSSVLLGVWLTITLLSSWALLRHQRSAARLSAKAEAAESAMRYSNARFEQLAQTIPCMLFDYEVLDQGEVRLTYISPYSRVLLGLAPDALLADYATFIKLVHPDDRAGFLAVIKKAITRRVAYECEFRLASSAGAPRWLKSTATPAPSDHDINGTHFSGFVFDITETKTQQLQLQEIAYQDPLTQADNRRRFMEKLQVELARAQRYGTPSSLLMLDIDFFKQVNDTYGHLVGDAVLKHLTSVVREGLRSVDSLGRLGGEEFAALLPGTGLDAALQLAERLRQAVQASPVTEAEHTVAVTISVGVVAITADLADTKTVLHRADKAMYQAKKAGRNRVCCAADAPDTNLMSLPVDLD